MTGEHELPATVGQKLLWMMDRYRGAETYGAFNCPVLFQVRGRLDVEALTAALHGLEDRHASLRTVFTRRGRDLVQAVHPPAAAAPRWRDVSGEPDPAAAAEYEIAQELRTRIDLTRWPARTTVWRLKPTRHIVCLNLHHIVTDAWSTGVLFRELQTLYAHRGDVTKLPPVPLQYPEFALRQQRQLAEGGLDREREYWLRQLAGARLACPPRSAAGDEAAPAPSGAPETGTASVSFAPRTADGLRDLAKANGTTLFAVLLAAYLSQLSRATGQSDVTVASLFANRLEPDTHGTVGFLANMVMLRCQEADAPWSTLLPAVHRTAVGAIAHERQPFQLLPPHLIATDGLRPDDVVFQMVTDPQYKGHAGGVEFELLVPESIGSRFSFELAVTPVGAGLRAVLFYRRDWFDQEWARAFVADYGKTLEAAAAGG